MENIKNGKKTRTTLLANGAAVTAIIIIMLGSIAHAQSIGIDLTPQSQSFQIGNMMPGDIFGPETITITNVGSMSIDKIGLSTSSVHHEYAGDASDLTEVMNVVGLIYDSHDITDDAIATVGDGFPPLTIYELEAGYILRDGVMDIGDSKDLDITILFDPSAGNEYQGDSLNVTFMFTALAPEIIINEIMYDPPHSMGDDDEYEWVELHNRDNVSIDLSGWKLIGSTTIIPDGTEIPAKGCLIIARDKISFLAYYGPVTCEVIQGNMELYNGGDTIILQDDTGEVIDTVTYDNTWGADGNGKTLERIYPERPSNNQSNWAESLINGGTPCIENSVSDITPPVIILDAPKNDSATNTDWIYLTITDNVKVDQAFYSTEKLFEDDFSAGAGSWVPVTGTWAVESGEYSSSRMSRDAQSYINSLTVSDALIDTRFKILTGTDGKEWIGIHARKTNPSDTYEASGYLAYIRHNGEIGIYKAGHGNLAAATVSYDPSTFNTFTFVQVGNTLKLMLNNVELLKATDSTYSNGDVSLWSGCSSPTHAHFDDVHVYAINHLPEPSYDISATTWSEGPVDLNVWAVDVAGNKNHAYYTFTIDRTLPAVTSVTLSDPTPTKAGTVTFTVTFSEDMDDSVNPAVTFGLNPLYDAHNIAGSWTNPTTWEGTYKIEDTTGDGDNTISISGAKDIAGNAMIDDTSHGFIIDTKKPKVVSVVVVPSPTKAGLTTFTIEFNENMDTLVALEVKFGLNNPYTKRTVTGSWSGSTTWTGTYAVAPTTGDGENTISIAKGRDIAGNQMKRDTTHKFLIDATFPSVKNPHAPDIYEGQDQTVTVEVFDEGSNTIDTVWVEDDGADYIMQAVPSNIPWWKYWVTAPEYTTYYAIIPGPSAGTHNLRFYASDTVGNVNDSVTDSYYVDDNILSPGGKIAYLCRYDSCNYATESKVIEWLEDEGWDVTGKKYNTWDDTELDDYDLIACSDESRACRIKRKNPEVYDEHKNQGTGFIEFADSRRARAAYDFGYTRLYLGSSGSRTTDLYVTLPDVITAGYFLETPVFTSRKRTNVFRDNRLKPEAVDLADFGSDRDKSALFKVDEAGDHGKYAWLPWFRGRTWYPGSSRVFPEDLTPEGEDILRRTVSWTQCGNPTGCA